MLNRKPPPILVLGIGNILLRDDGLGVRAVEAMRQMDLPQEIELVDGGTAGANLLDIMCDRQKVIVVDAMDAGAAPGTIVRMTLEDLASRRAPVFSSHEFSLLETVAMAQHLSAAPAELVLIGVQPQEWSAGDRLTPAIQSALPQVIEKVLNECATGGLA
jgi:hydrogenase maturation protease